VIATIHQPDFLPWFGLFNKIAKADVWVVLDHVTNNPRDAAFWGRRVQILVNGRPTWLSIPLRRPVVPGVVGIPICEMRINMDDPRSLDKAWQTVRMAYARAPFFDTHAPIVETYFTGINDSLVHRNMGFVSRVLDLLEVRTRLVSSATLGATTRSTALLVDLLERVGATTYLCGTGAGGYQEDALFAERGITLRQNTFVHPEHPQLRTPTFVPGLSILDMLFNVPVSDVRAWVHRA